MHYEQYLRLKSQLGSEIPKASLALFSGAISPWSSVLKRPESRREYYIQSFLGAIFPPLGNYYSSRDSMAYMDDYMRNRGLDWGNIKYPSRTVGWSVGSNAVGALNYVSRNLDRLYR